MTIKATQTNSMTNRPAGDPVAKTDAIASPVLPAPTVAKEVEIGGPSGPEPTRYGDWERGGRCTDF